jgi:hypothetical protein
LPDKYHDDVPVLEKAKNLVKTKNLDPNEGIVKNFDTVLDTPDATLIDIASIVGVSLESSLDMISENLTLLRTRLVGLLGMLSWILNQLFYNQWL